MMNEIDTCMMDLLPLLILPCRFASRVCRESVAVRGESVRGVTVALPFQHDILCAITHLFIILQGSLTS